MGADLSTKGCVSRALFLGNLRAIAALCTRVAVVVNQRRPETAMLWRWKWLGFVGAILAFGAAKGGAEPVAPPGFRPVPLGSHALTGGQVITEPGNTISNATILIRDGRIVAVGSDIALPPDARVWDLRGQIVYPGLIDPYLTLSTTNVPLANRRREAVGAGATAMASDPSAGGYRFFGVAGQEADPGEKGPGYAIAGITPERKMGDAYTPNAKQLEELRELGFTAANIVPSRGILRGQSAFVTLGDSSPNEALIQLHPNQGTAQHFAFEVPGGDGVFPGSLMGTLAAVRQVLHDARWWSNAQASFQANPAQATRPPVNIALSALLPIWQGQPVFWESGSALMGDRARLLAQEFGITQLVLVSSGDEWRRADLIAATPVTYIAPLAFPALPKFPRDDGWEGVSLDQLRGWDWAPENPALLRQRNARLALTTFGLSDRKEFRKNLATALDRGLSEADALAALTTIPAQICRADSIVGTVAPGKLANLTICDAKGYFDPKGRVLAVWVAGRPYEFLSEESNSADDAEGNQSTSESAAREKSDQKKAESRELARKRVAQDPLVGRGVLTNPPAVLIRGATVWTCGDAGILTNAQLLVRGSRIESITTNEVTNPEIFVIEGAGLHVTPGLIDCHSHSMIMGGVNEGTLPSSAMVRIGDVVNSETDTIHQQLAGGLTIANLLHGSANPIGGQNQVIKLREGASPEGLKFTNAPSGIKFALGENVKQANWGEKFTTRFPQTRMGVQTFYQNRFTAARQYAAAWKTWRDAGSRGAAPRQDLELDALVEILGGSRLVHCHSYRQDEILAFLRTMESFGIRVATLQHILEGYKVADEIAKHGAGASAFSDWWAFKFEVYDAIPYAGSLMHSRGVNVSFNSDSNDHARRLNFEAAKAVKYGGTPEVEALKFVTINPAKQLGIDRWVGSLEPGKDADFVIWSGHPLASSSRCLQTWIDGKLHFDRVQEPAKSAQLAAERTTLIGKAKKLSGKGADAGASDQAREKFFQRALERSLHWGVQWCEDCQFPQRD